MTSNDIIFCTNETCSKRTVCRRGQTPTFTSASFCQFTPQCDTAERFRCDHFWPVNGEICNVCGHSLFLHAEYDYTGDTIRCCDCTFEERKAANVPFFFKQGSQANWSNFKDFDTFPTDLQIRSPLQKRRMKNDT